MDIIIYSGNAFALVNNCVRVYSTGLYRDVDGGRHARYAVTRRSTRPGVKRPPPLRSRFHRAKPVQNRRQYSPVSSVLPCFTFRCYIRRNHPTPLE